MVVVPNTHVAMRGIVIRSVVNLSHGLGGFSMRRNLNKSLGLPAVNIRVVGTPQMVYTNPIMTTHVHKTIDIPLMSSITKVQTVKIQKEDIENHLS